MQPLRGKEEVEFTTRGRKFLKLLFTHASRFARHASCAGGIAEEECGRELEQEKEAEQEEEEDISYELASPRVEVDWTCWQQALMCNLQELQAVVGESGFMSQIWVAC